MIILLLVFIYALYVFGSYVLMPYVLRGFCSFVGLRGSGKSNLATCIAQFWIKKGKRVFSNFPIKGCYEYDISDLGTYMIKDCILILDEAGIDMSNRKFMEKSIKGIKENNRKFWKLTRHYGINNIYLFSQAFDYDVTLRRLCDRQFILTKSAIPNFTLITMLRQIWSVTEEGDSPCVKMEIMKFPHLRCYRKPWFKYYDSYIVDELPCKDFNLYRFDVGSSSGNSLPNRKHRLQRKKNKSQRIAEKFKLNEVVA